MKNIFNLNLMPNVYMTKNVGNFRKCLTPLSFNDENWLDRYPDVQLIIVDFYGIKIDREFQYGYIRLIEWDSCCCCCVVLTLAMWLQNFCLCTHTLIWAFRCVFHWTRACHCRCICWHKTQYSQCFYTYT